MKLIILLQMLLTLSVFADSIPHRCEVEVKKGNKILFEKEKVRDIRDYPSVE